MENGGNPVNRRILFFLAVGLAFSLAFQGLIPRWSAEMGRRKVGILAEYRDMKAMSLEQHLPFEAALARLQVVGFTGFLVGEFTGEELAQGPLPLWYGPLAQLPPEVRTAALSSGLPEDAAPGGAEAPTPVSLESLPSDRGTLWVPSGEEDLAEEAEQFARLKFPELVSVRNAAGHILVLPQSFADLFAAGVLPDLEGLARTRRLAVPVVYRPAMAPGVLAEHVAALTRGVVEANAQIRCIAPSGAVVAGYPDLLPLAALLKEKELAAAQVEFSRQLGSAALDWYVFPDLLPLHSVTQDEVLSKRVSRGVMVERMLRAAKERSVRLLLLRPYLLESGERFLKFEDDVRRINEGLRNGGYETGWPVTYGRWGQSLLAAVACALLLVFCGMNYLWRLRRSEESVLSPFGFVVLLLLAGGLGVAAWKVSLLAKMLGALCAVAVVTDATLFALDGWRKPHLGIVQAIFVLVSGGLSIAAFYGVPLYMLRLLTFSGVKATLLLPPALILFHDLKRREHPESLGEVLGRPSRWGELALIGFMLLGAAFLALRSDNVNLVPGWEVTLRDALERLLVARPRNKELFIGYPALVLWYVVRRMDIWSDYREALRLASVFAFSSALNSFCHFHTPIFFTLWRVGNGLWAGLLLGAVLAALFRWVAFPLWRHARGAFFE